MKKRYLVIDFETLDTIPTSIVLSFGCLAFNPDDIEDINQECVEKLRKQGKHWVFNVKLQNDRTASRDTIEWWKNHREQADIIFKATDTISLNDWMDEFDEFCAQHIDKNTIVMIRGQDFDAPIIKDIYRRAGRALPFNEWKIRDTRTLVDFAFNVNNGYVPGFKDLLHTITLVEHYALDDCIKDAYQIALALETKNT